LYLYQSLNLLALDQSQQNTTPSQRTINPYPHQELADALVESWENGDWEDSVDSGSEGSESDEYNDSFEDDWEEGLDQTAGNLQPIISWLQGNRHSMLVADSYIFYQKRHNIGTNGKQARQVYHCKERLTCGCDSKVIMRDEVYVSSKINHFHEDHQLDIELIKIRQGVKALSVSRPDVSFKLSLSELKLELI
jgi:hypothetical protein